MFATLATLLVALTAAPEISAASTDADGFLRHVIRCEYQAGETSLRVLLPTGIKPGEKLRVMLVLPVEPQEEHKYGDGLAEVRRHDLHNKHRLICASPSFSHLPWYADHPTDARVRQETYLLKVVLPALRERYPCSERPDDCLLLGFSKSGWGAWSLLLRHPDMFGRVAAWDSPLVESAPKKYGMSVVFPSDESFAQYDLTKILRQRADSVRGRRRLGLFGYDNFYEQTTAMHQLLDELQVPHEYRSTERRKHLWNTGWVPEAVEFLVARD